jgi:hypothetical protein
MILQDYTNSEVVVLGPYVQTYPESHGSNQAVKIKVEEDDAQEEVKPLHMTVQKIKTEPEVSCMSVSPLLDRYHKYAQMSIVFIIFICLSVHMKQLHCADDWPLKKF